MTSSRHPAISLARPVSLSPTILLPRPHAGGDEHGGRSGEKWWGRGHEVQSDAVPKDSIIVPTRSSNGLAVSICRQDSRHLIDIDVLAIAKRKTTHRAFYIKTTFLIQMNR